MKKHHYRITVEHLEGAQEKPSPDHATLEFEAASHDDLFAIVERMRQRGDFTESTATAFAVGLKLFGEVMLENRQHPLFTEFAPHFGEFMKKLKKGPPQQ